MKNAKGKNAVPTHRLHFFILHFSFYIIAAPSAHTQTPQIPTNPKKYCPAVFCLLSNGRQCAAACLKYSTSCGGCRQQWYLILICLIERKDLWRNKCEHAWD